MTSDSIRIHLDAAPFVPFTVHLADGQTYLIDHPDFVTLMKDDRTLFVNTTGGRFALVSIPQITRVEGMAAQPA